MLVLLTVVCCDKILASRVDFNNLACALSSSFITLRSAFNVEHPYDSIGWMATLSMCADTMGDTPFAHRPADCRP